MPLAPESSRSLAAQFDLRHLSAEFYADPFPTYRALREHEPVKRLPDGGVFLTRYVDCEFVYKNPKLFSSDKQREFKPKYGDSPLYEHHTTSLVFNDPPLHTRVRRLIIGALSPRAITELQPGLVALVDRLLDELERKRSFDLIEDFAAAIPIEVIGNLLAVPKGERGHLRGWSLAILGALEPALTPEAFERGNTAVREFLEYLEGLVTRRRADPGDPQRDVLTNLIVGETNGERLSAKELLHNCIFLLNAGHETTTNLIGNGLVALALHPEQKARLIERPELLKGALRPMSTSSAPRGGSSRPAEPDLLKSAVEEILRFESSNQLGNRMTTQDVEVGGVALAAHTSITLCIGAANRDPAQFSDPERFDIARAPNRHLAFGSGIHQCAGMGLARMEGEVAIARFLERIPNFTLVGTPVRGGRARFRGYLSVPCRAADR